MVRRYRVSKYLLRPRSSNSFERQSPSETIVAVLHPAFNLVQHACEAESVKTFDQLPLITAAGQADPICLACSVTFACISCITPLSRASGKLAEASMP